MARPGKPIALPYPYVADLSPRAQDQLWHDFQALRDIADSVIPFVQFYGLGNPSGSVQLGAHTPDWEDYFSEVEDEVGSTLTVQKSGLYLVHATISFHDITTDTLYEMWIHRGCLDNDVTRRFGIEMDLIYFYANASFGVAQEQRPRGTSAILPLAAGEAVSAMAAYEAENFTTVSYDFSIALLRQMPVTPYPPCDL